MGIIYTADDLLSFTTGSKKPQKKYAYCLVGIIKPYFFMVGLCNYSVIIMSGTLKPETNGEKSKLVL